jgi:hypothetical protein
MKYLLYHLIVLLDCHKHLIRHANRPHKMYGHGLRMNEERVPERF